MRLFSDTLAACEELMLQGQAHFLLCHRHALAASRFEPSRFTSIAVGKWIAGPAGGAGCGWCAALVDRRGRRQPAPACLYGGICARRIFAAHHIADRVPALENAFSAQLAATLLAKAREGHGIAWLPVGVAAKDMASGALVRAGGPEGHTDRDRPVSPGRATRRHGGTLRPA